MMLATRVCGKWWRTRRKEVKLSRGPLR